MRPMLATLTDTVPSGPEWVHEVKWDGMRLLADAKGGGLTLTSRSGLPTACSRATSRPSPATLSVPETSTTPTSGRARTAAVSSSTRSCGSSTRTAPANFPPRRPIWLSSQLPPCSATVRASSATSPGRSSAIRLMTMVGMVRG